MRYFLAGRGSEGETSISWGKLSGKRTVIHYPLERAFRKATEGEISEALGLGVIS